jgi:hypothetical protein
MSSRPDETTLEDPVSKDRHTKTRRRRKKLLVPKFYHPLST